MEQSNIIRRLDRIEKSLKFIEEHVVDRDTIMTPEEERDLKKAMKEFNEGKTTSLEDLKKELDD